jgi:hypothetical protein
MSRNVDGSVLGQVRDTLFWQQEEHHFVRRLQALSHHPLDELV